MDGYDDKLFADGRDGTGDEDSSDGGGRAHGNGLLGDIPVSVATGGSPVVAAGLMAPHRARLQVGLPRPSGWAALRQAFLWV